MPHFIFKQVPGAQQANPVGNGVASITITSNGLRDITQDVRAAQARGVKEISLVGPGPFHTDVLAGGVTINGGGTAVLSCKLPAHGCTPVATTIGPGKARLVGLSFAGKRTSFQVEVKPGQSVELVNVVSPSTFRAVGGGEVTLQRGSFRNVQLVGTTQFNNFGASIQGRVTRPATIEQARAESAGISPTQPSRVAVQPVPQQPVYIS
jgi:hypothetical protein